jgi:D-glycero-D-manno-heptose 1,7-bisphosphate phosphatase
MSRPAIFLDRDGVLIENVDSYVRTWDDVRFLPGTFESMRRLRATPYTVVLVTNQSAVGRGILTAEQALDINGRVVAEIAARGGQVDASYVCLHSPADGCACRKPAPGMLLSAQADLGLDLAASYLIGDAATDIAAATAAGVRGILVRTGRGTQQAAALAASGDDAGCPIVDDLPAALNHILPGVPHA